MSGLSKSWYEFALQFNTQSAKIHEWARGKGFWTIINTQGSSTKGLVTGIQADTSEPNIVAAKLALIHSEISEALEAHRNHDAMDDKLPDRKGIEVELADAVIRIMDLNSALGLDVGGAIGEKMAFNNNRPHKHGKDY